MEGTWLAPRTTNAGQRYLATIRDTTGSVVALWPSNGADMAHKPAQPLKIVDESTPKVELPASVKRPSGGIVQAPIMVRKGSGWINVVLQIPWELLESGVVKAHEIHDWDNHGNTERRLVPLAKANEPRR